MEALLWEGQMAVGLIMQFSGVDAAKYDAIQRQKCRLASGYHQPCSWSNRGRLVCC
jgi:hypothetical protein